MKKVGIVGGITLILLVVCFQLYKKDIRKEEPRKVLGVSLIGPTHQWPEGVRVYAKEKVNEIAERNNWDYILTIGKDSNEQSRQIIELADKKVDCLVILPMDGASLKTAAVTAQKQGIPIVIFDREIPDFNPEATVKGDNYGIGTKTAAILNDEFPKGTTVLEIMGDTSTVPFQRMDGYNNKIAASFHTVEIGYTGWQRGQAKQLFKDWVNTAPEEEKEAVEAVYTHDDEIALGVLDALDEYKASKQGEKMLKNLRVIAGSSGSQEFYKRIASEGEYELFSLTYSPDMVQKALDIAEKIIKKEDYEEMTVFPTLEVNKKNVRRYLNDKLPF